jgi:hypothetical protein
MKENRKTRYTRMILQNSLMELMKTRPVSDISVKEICALADISGQPFMLIAEVRMICSGK